MFDFAQLSDLLQVVLVDFTLAGDNAIVVALAARGLRGSERRNAIVWGIAIATLLRVPLAFGAVHLLKLVGLTLAGGILLLWVAWKMFRELMAPPVPASGTGGDCAEGPKTTLAAALFRIVLADVSMSLDNVLAVAGTARGHFWILALGLALSIGLMGFASTYVARLLDRFPWVTWLGLGIVSYVACSMIGTGWSEVAPHLSIDGIR